MCPDPPFRSCREAATRTKLFKKFQIVQTLGFESVLAESGDVYHLFYMHTVYIVVYVIWYMTYMYIGNNRYLSCNNKCLSITTVLLLLLLFLFLLLLLLLLLLLWLWLWYTMTRTITVTIAIAITLLGTNTSPTKALFCPFHRWDMLVPGGYYWYYYCNNYDNYTITLIPSGLQLRLFLLFGIILYI